VPLKLRIGALLFFSGDGERKRTQAGKLRKGKNEEASKVRKGKNNSETEQKQRTAEAAKRPRLNVPAHRKRAALIRPRPKCQY